MLPPNNILVLENIFSEIDQHQLREMLAHTGVQRIRTHKDREEMVSVQILKPGTNLPATPLKKLVRALQFYGFSPDEFIRIYFNVNRAGETRHRHQDFGGEMVCFTCVVFLSGDLTTATPLNFFSNEASSEAKLSVMPSPGTTVIFPSNEWHSPSYSAGGLNLVINFKNKETP